MKKKSLLFATAAMLTTSMATTIAAHAEDKTQGLYGSIGAGYNFLESRRDLEGVSAFSNGIGVNLFDSEIDYDEGIAAFAAVGYDWGNSWRTELEFTYRNNDVELIPGDGLGFGGFPEDSTSGDLTSYSLMANLIYDLDFLNDVGGFGLPVTPYIGGGAGVVFADLEVDSSNPNGPPGFTDFTVSESRPLAAVQGIAGLAFAINEGLSLDISYRYLASSKREFDATLNGAAIGANTAVTTHTILASLRWNFGPAAAAAAAAPAAAAIQYKDCWDGSQVPLSASCPPELVEQVADVPDPIQVTVYFDFDRSNLTSEASSLIDEAVNRARNFDYDTVTVVGNTDRSGSSAYNQALSERRARVVRDALIARGIPASAIRSNALGESNPAKATPDGVREPLNRRTNITINFE